ncbi:hypothetical protein OU994_18050 [Pseudoduganella sp. SL102]|uniref:phage adaptor protein n=1 Tax=Pseudoduganella sp. SL102 TaxID=2995154 RepID=UPI00248B89AC|nr:hypothetical protein [Pseudoduganella sp. SL102]WBS00224.1 hypothetical protein OU994_18050 [Pseudoduganella sp. SL102]
MMQTYAELKAAIIDRSHRKDLAARVPGFIRNAELEIHRRLTAFPKEVEAPLTLVAGDRFIDLPAGYGSPLAMWRTAGGERCDVVMTTAVQLPASTTAGPPACWAVNGAKLAFDKPADVPYILVFRYLQTVFLSDDAPTNELFARSPDLFFYGALVELADFCRDDRNLSVYAQRFAGLLRSVAAEAARSNAVPLRTEIAAALGARGSYNRHGVF